MSPDNFGIQNTITILGAADFRPQGTATVDYFGPGYIRTTGGDGVLWAPVHLPNGANVSQLCVWYYNADPTDDIHVEWAAYGLGFLTAPPFYFELEDFFLDNTGGYNVGCVNPNTTIRALTDLNGDMAPDYPAYRVAVYLNNTADQRVGGVFLEWNYQLSPAPAAATFADVPPGDFGFQYVEALVDSGITGGCGGGNYCPDNFVTRRQMAIFIAKALGLYWPY